jgi:hypothetical protein
MEYFLLKALILGTTTMLNLCQCPAARVVEVHDTQSKNRVASKVFLYHNRTVADRMFQIKLEGA